MEILRRHIGGLLEATLRPIAQALAKSDVSPNHVTVAGLLVNVAAAWLIMQEAFFFAGVIYLLGGGVDLLDGMLARASDKVSAAGAYLDSMLDRISEGVVLAAISYVFAREGQAGDASLVLLALLGSLMVSYTRARAEALGIDCKMGVATRAERVVLVAFGLVTGWLAPVIYVLVVLTGITVIQRIHATLRGLSGQR